MLRRGALRTRTPKDDLSLGRAFSRLSSLIFWFRLPVPGPPAKHNLVVYGSGRE